MNKYKLYCIHNFEIKYRYRDHFFDGATGLTYLVGRSKKEVMKRYERFITSYRKQGIKMGIEVKEVKVPGFKISISPLEKKLSS